MFYRFNQNNSGGEFKKINGLSASNVFVQANSAEEANDRAEEFGLYFYGCEDGRDCPCCGDRWNMADEKWTDKYPAIKWPVVGNGQGDSVVIYENGIVSPIQYYSDERNQLYKSMLGV
jgi:hypothetical protein